MTNQMTIVRSWASNVRGAEAGFLKAVVWSLEQFQHKNNAPLAEMVALCAGKTLKGFKTLEGEKLAQFNVPLRLILSHVLADTKLTIKDGREKFVVGANGGVNSDRLEALRMIVAQGLTVRSDAFKSAFPKVVKEAAPKDDAAIREQFLKYAAKFAKDHNLSVDTLRHMLDAKPTATVEVAH